MEPAPQSCNGSAEFNDCHLPIRLPVAQAKFQAEAVRGVCDTGQYRMPYYSWGSGAGPTLIFIPGLCDDSLSFLLPISRLAEKFRCVAYDLPTGRGDGAKLGGYRHADLVGDFFALIDQLHLEDAIPVGSSFGSTIALSALAQDAKRLKRGIIQGGFARRSLAPAERMLASWARFWPWQIRYLPFRYRVLRSLESWNFNDRDPLVFDFFLDRHGSPPMRAVAHRALLLHQVDLKPILPTISQEVLMICGENDPLIGKECEKELITGLPHVLRAEIEGAGHLPQFTHPEVLAEVIGRFTAGALGEEHSHAV